MTFTEAVHGEEEGLPKPVIDYSERAIRIRKALETHGLFENLLNSAREHGFPEPGMAVHTAIMRFVRDEVLYQNLKKDGSSTENISAILDLELRKMREEAKVRFANPQIGRARE